ncbi:hypothetical protein BH92_03820 [Rhodococcoides fascians A21d2]|uniref:hypothetical protein n=1 Tax=Rhodococcoides fascians TaxID=1828 RepID=UPI0012D326BF|nr:hypothetical protein [Rhodococcus fascians]QIH99110.1 hypothetical protein BH92_03820 [Rhodococcus fascians A21d2]
MTAPEAAAAWQLLEEMADTLCPKDPRGKKERLCDAFMARMHGEPRLTCLCRRADCPKKDAALPGRRVPLTMITVDIATLIGLLANTAYLAGHGSIDPDLARELARNSQWQVLLTEAITLAEKLGLAVQNPETGVWERRSDSEKTGAATGPEAGTATEPDADRDTDTDADADRDEGVDSAADADAATAAHGDGGMGAATDSGREAHPSTEPTSDSSPAPAPAPAPAQGNTSAPAPDALASKFDDAEQHAPIPTADPSTTPDPDPAEPVRKHAATRAGAAVTDPQPEPTSDTDPETAASSEPASAPPLAADQTPPAPDVAPSCSESRSSTTPSGSTPPSDSATSRPTSAEGPAPGTGSAAAAAVSNGQHQRRVGSLTSAAALFCTHTPVGRGTRHSSALDLPSAIRRNRTIPTAGHTPSGLYLGNASLAAALEAAIAADPTLGKSVARDPLTDRALIYRPDTLTTAAVRLRDRHCRFPGCHRPADRCQLDHVIPFDHANPLGGGWTTVDNLQCLCEFHHTVKTAGYWTAVMLPGGAILWRSTSKTIRITLPANRTAVPIIGNDLRPHIPTKPRRSGIIAYPDPPDNEQPETDDTALPF